MVILIFVGLILAMLCLFLSIRGVFEEKQLIVQAALVGSPIKSLASGIGAAVIVFGVFIGLQATGVGPLRLLSVTITAIGLLAVIFGLASVATILGERVLALRKRESSPFAHTSVGTLLLAVLGALPFLGWFLIAPVAALLGLGAVVLSAKRRISLAS